MIFFVDEQKTWKMKYENTAIMTYPEFFNRIPKIQLKDSLADFLGALENGIVEFSYLDVVKLAGHSCPTVAGAYLMTYKSLKKLYPETWPQRGEIKVEFRDAITEGVIGVISNVVTQITGATRESGFKGIGGDFVRHSLMDFDVPMEGMIRFTRVDNGASIEVDYNPIVPVDPRQSQLMQKIRVQQASEEEKEEFRQIWQGRVRGLLVDHFDDPRIVLIKSERL